MISVLREEQPLEESKPLSLVACEPAPAWFIRPTESQVTTCHAHGGQAPVARRGSGWGCEEEIDSTEGLGWKPLP